MPLINMKVPEDAYDAMPSNPYGYGLCLCLTEEQVEALGLASNPPTVGSTVGGRFVATVTRLVQETEAGDEDADIDVRLELQITDLEVGGSGSSPTAADLYGGSND